MHYKVCRWTTIKITAHTHTCHIHIHVHVHVHVHVMVPSNIHTYIYTCVTCGGSLLSSFEVLQPLSLLDTVDLIHHELERIIWFLIRQFCSDVLDNYTDIHVIM